MEKYIQRLTKEWLEHGKIIIAVDFDDTLKAWGFKGDDLDIAKTIKLLREAKQTGCYIVVFTACDKSRYLEIFDYCEAFDIDVDCINENPIDLPYGNDKKIYANIFLDDRAGLPMALEILETAMYQVRGKLQLNNSYPGQLG